MIKASLIAIFLTGCSFAAHGQSFIDEQTNYHHVYVKPDFFVGRPTEYRYKIGTYTYNIFGWSYSIKQQIPFYTGINLTYEYINPNSFFFHAQWAEAYTTFRQDVVNWGSDSSVKVRASISNLEASAGFNFHKIINNLSTIPFLGFGRYLETQSHDIFNRENNNRSQLIYAALGNKLLYNFSHTLDIGIFAKIMRPLYRKSKERVYNLIVSSKGLRGFLYEFSLPVSWHFKNRWEAQAEPFLFTLGSFSYPFLGARLALGHTF